MLSFKVARCVYTLAYGPDSTTLWIGDGSGKVHRWDLSEDKGKVAFQVIPGSHTSAVLNLAVSVDGGLVASSSYGEVTLWDVATGHGLATPGGEFPSALRLALSPRGDMIFVAGTSGEGVLWDRAVQSLDLVGEQRGFARNAAFSPNSALVAVSYMTSPGLSVFDTTTLHEVTSLEAQSIEALLFCPDGSRLVVAAGNEISLWDTSDWKLVKKFRAGQAFVRRMAIHPDGQLIATAADVKMVCLWDVEGQSRGKFDFEVGKSAAVAFAPDGMTAAVGGSNGKVAVWDLEEM